MPDTAPRVAVRLDCGCDDSLPDDDSGHPWEVGDGTLCDTHDLATITEIFR